tara:strand:- start:107 stop:361 length:255 start_codon:yes stop_codon:yes gene_type:complete
MNSLSFQKFKGQLSERRYGGPEKGKEYKNLSPKMKAAVDDVYSMIDKTSDPLIGKVEGIISQVAKKHGINVSSIERYIDTEIIK